MPHDSGVGEAAVRGVLLFHVFYIESIFFLANTKINLLK